MADIYNKNKRSKIMSHNRCKGNKSTELRLIEYLKRHRITGWRRGYNVKGHPDFVFSNEKVAIFVDGCFWHGHICKHLPSTNLEYWANKIEENKIHDLAVNERFENRGWIVLRIWECELKRKNEEKIIVKILGVLNKLDFEETQN